MILLLTRCALLILQRMHPSILLEAKAATKDVVEEIPKVGGVETKEVAAIEVINPIFIALDVIGEVMKLLPVERHGKRSKNTEKSENKMVNRVRTLHLLPLLQQNVLLVSMTC